MENVTLKQGLQWHVIFKGKINIKKKSREQFQGYSHGQPEKLGWDWSSPTSQLFRNHLVCTKCIQEWEN